MSFCARFLLVAGFAAAIVMSFSGCDRPSRSSVNCVLAPPGPAELGPATGLSTPPEGAIVFDLKYKPQTGGPGDIRCYSFWGFGGLSPGEKRNSFLQAVQSRTASLWCERNPNLKGREYAAVEHDGREATALFFDLNANGKLDENERIPPTRREGDAVVFITPDFTQKTEDDAEMLCRVLLQVSFYEGSSDPNCMWSAAAVMEGTATLNGESLRLLLYPDRPAGLYSQFGSSGYALLSGQSASSSEHENISYETLSSLISKADQFFRLTIEGRRSNGLPARAFLVKDTRPTGSLALKFAGTNSLKSAATTLYVRGVNDKTVFFRTRVTDGNIRLPAGDYELNNGTLTYGSKNANEWEALFSRGPRASIKAGEVQQVMLGQPTLQIRAVEEKNRYQSDATESSTFKKGTRIYLEPRIVGLGGETLTRFRRLTGSRTGNNYSPPKVTITGADGRQVLSKTMEYG